MTSKSKVLHLLEQHRGSYISGEELAKKIEISRSGVWKAINELKKEGYHITAVTNKGYCLETESDLLSVEGMAPYLPPDFPLELIHIYKSVDSTNNEVKRLAVSGGKHQTVVMAEEQTGGRGRLGRSFYSPPGSGIYLSMLLRPTISTEKSVLVTTAASVAVCRAVEKVTGKPCVIKWVNDVYSGGRKICGILTEAVTNVETGCIESIVLGIGINFKGTAEDFPEEIRNKAGFLFAKDTGTITRNQLAAAEITELLKLPDQLESGSFLPEYRRRSVVLGKQVQVVSSSGTRTALVQDIDDCGGLVVRWEDDGTTGVIRTGEVSIRGLFDQE
ncbi:MAG: biotin--[acetyl-CoA-carboxylase] ligase [Oscillospiraceae bacterium]|nr:biotin--[acetyl-CoA-carboxylase] ligase [Oscillospiraceae bacterium]